ncbi:hypothetical protein AAC387_Pa01g1058 [Persea americana]
MGAICSKGLKEEQKNLGIRTKDQRNSSAKLKTMNSIGKQVEGMDFAPVYEEVREKYDSGELKMSKSGELKAPTHARTGAGRVPEIGSFLGRAGIVGLERAVDVLDTLGSSMSSLNPSSGFASGMSTRGNKICILAFEVANTIAKGANLMQSLSEENIKILKVEILHSEGVQLLVSTDMKELLSIAASDKREELDTFSREVVRFGDRCKDPQWHNLDRYFQKLDSDHMAQKLLQEEAETAMQELTNLAQQTSELYHELHTLDRFEQDYQRKHQEEVALHAGRRGESLMILHSELKHQKKLVRSLRKKSLWAKNLEEVVEKLVDIVTFLHLEIIKAFGNKGDKVSDKGLFNNPQRLGVSGLALHYANIISQIDNIVSRPSSVPPNTRDALYHGLSPGVKAALRSNLQMLDPKEELTIAEIKDEMEKTLRWLVPVATNTTKAHQGFGWVGEWANTGNDFHKKMATQNNLIRLQTLHHADKEKTDKYILELVTWLHRLVSQVKYRDHGLKSIVPARSPTQKGFSLSLLTSKDPSQVHDGKTNRVQLSQEDVEMLKEVMYKRLVPGISKSQEFGSRKKKRGSRDWGSCRSSGNSPTRQLLAASDLDSGRTNVLDVMDGLSTH